MRFLLLLTALPLAVLGDGHGMEEPMCCMKKMVGMMEYTYYMEDEQALYEYGCKDKCVYMHENQKYCFAHGEMDVECMKDGTMAPTYAPSNPAGTTMGTYAPSNPAGTTMGTAGNSMGTYAPSMVPSTTGGMMMNSTTTAGGCKCGKKKPGTENKDSRIVGGIDAEVNEWPWMAAISYSTTGSGQGYGCGASLVSDQWLVTAAHCFYQDGQLVVQPGQITVVLGDHDKSMETDTNIKLVQYISEIKIHPNYNDQTSENDIALLKMTTTVNLDIYTPVCLPSPGTVFSSGMAWAYGWGTLSSGGVQPNILQEVALPLTSLATCQSQMAANANVNIATGMLCAGGEAGKDACQGDSGGPLTVDVNGQHYLAGAVSFGIGCAQGGLFGVYADVAYYRVWMEETMGMTGFCPL